MKADKIKRTIDTIFMLTMYMYVYAQPTVLIDKSVGT